MEEQTRRWAAGQVDVHVGRQNIPGNERRHWGDHCGEQERRLADESGQAEVVGRKVEQRQFGIDWRRAVVNVRREGGARRDAQERCDGYGQGLQGQAEESTGGCGGGAQEDVHQE